MEFIRATAVLFVFLPAVASGQTVGLWAPTVKPSRLDGGDPQAVELGLKFRSDIAGAVAGVKFYKGSANKGTHIGNLWTTGGTRLATVTFTGETASGWQQAYFSKPVTIQANTTYIISYYTSVGHYSISQSYFSSNATDNAPLHAPSGSNGVYRYGTRSSFPTQSWYSSNYWVDVIFQPSSTPTIIAASTTLNSSLNPSTAGQAVTLSASVTAASGVPTGSIQFKDGSTVLATSTLVSGQASMVISSLATGTHSITASYGGSSTYSSRTSPVLVQTVNPVPAAATTTSLSASPNPSSAGQTVKFIGTVSAANGTPAGSLQFRDGSTVLATVTLAGGQVSLVTSSLAAGTHSITASYLGSSTYLGSASPVLVQTVNYNPATSTSLSSSLNPSAPGQAVTFTGTVSAASGAPTGSIKFIDGSSVLGTATLGAGGTAVVAVTSLAIGTRSITAVYSGDSNHSGSSSPALSQQVQQTIAHSVSLNWIASSSANVVGYNVYRGASSGGPYVKLNSNLVGTTDYTDTSVQAGQMYYFVCTAVDGNNSESGYSNESEATVPSS